MENPTLSDFTLRGFTTVKLKIVTKSRLNDAKNEIFGRGGRAVTHDQLINWLLDQHLTVVIAESPTLVAQPVP